MDVDVLIPAYESPELVKAAIQSALMQRGVDVRVVVSDDSESAAVEVVVKGFNSEHVQYTRHQRTGRPVDNWNAVLHSARADYVVLLHQDETFTRPDALLDGVQVLRRFPQLGAYVFGHCIRRADGVNGAGSGLWARVTALMPQFIYFSNHVGSPSNVMFSRQTMTTLFDPSLRWLVDVDWFFRNFGRRGLFFSEHVDLVSRADVGMGITRSLDVRSVERDEIARLREAHPEFSVKVFLLGRLMKRFLKDCLGVRS